VSAKKGIPLSETAYIPTSQEVVIMAHGNASDEELAVLLRCAAEAVSAPLRGDIRTYLALVPHAEDYTLMDPFGGEPTRGFDPSSEDLEALERFFEADSFYLPADRSRRTLLRLLHSPPPGKHLPQNAAL
jgi:hypothetical protein